MTIPTQSTVPPLVTVAGRSSALGEAAKEVFSLMVGSQVSVSAPVALPSANVTGVIGIGGAFRGVLTLRCSSASAVKVASQMLAVPVEEATEQSADAIAEICNQIAGLFKAKIGHEASSMLAIPTVITGSDYVVKSSRPPEIELALLHEGQPISLSLEIRD